MAKYLIVGGVAGGMTAAARLRRIDEKSQIIVFERGEYISYANCGLPYYIGDVIKERESILVQTVEAFHARFNVDIRIKSEVLSINRKKKTVKVRDLTNQREYEENYDKLILSPGAEPIIPNIPGIKHKNIFSLRNVPDAEHIKEFVHKNKPKRALIVGAGFIGLEMAENLKHAGVFVTVVEMANQVMNLVDYEIAASVSQHLKIKGVEFYLNDAVSSFSEERDKLVAKLESGRQIPVDMVILSIGIKPENILAKDSGLEVGTKGGIVVNEYLQTKDDDIYALGDAIEVFNPILNKMTLIPLAGPANKQGRIVADNIIHGNKKKYSGTIGTAIAKIFDLTLAVTGVSEKQLKKEGIPYISSIIHASSHAGYYPDALPMTVKIQFSPDNGKLLGAQIVGYEGVDKRIDAFAIMINNNKTVYELSDFEHAYAPPYSSAKDPVNIAGYVAENILTGKLKIISYEEIARIPAEEVCFLDVRTTEEAALGMIDHSLNIPVDEIRKRIKEIPRNKKIITYCGVGLRGYVAARILMQSGFEEVYNLSGGYKTYELALQKQDNRDVFEDYKVGLDDLIHNIPEKTAVESAKRQISVNACGLQCPGPIMKVKTEIEKISFGDAVSVVATDPGFYNDIQSWVRVTGNKLLSLNTDKGQITAVIEKIQSNNQPASQPSSSQTGTTLVVFNNDLDRVIASFVIANGAVSMGKKVTMFFTFWGLNVLRKSKSKIRVKKNFIEKMFGKMMPKGSKKLSLSKMNMMGMGKKLIRGIMKKKNIESLESMIQSALQSGVELIACQMSMDVMGIKIEELMDGVKVGGVAMYLEATENAGANLFI